MIPQGKIDETFWAGVSILQNRSIETTSNIQYLYLLIFQYLTTPVSTGWFWDTSLVLFNTPHFINYLMYWFLVCAMWLLFIAFCVRPEPQMLFSSSWQCLRSSNVCFLTFFLYIQQYIECSKKKALKRVTERTDTFW